MLHFRPAHHRGAPSMDDHHRLAPSIRGSQSWVVPRCEPPFVPISRPDSVSEQKKNPQCLFIPPPVRGQLTLGQDVELLWGTELLARWQHTRGPRASEGRETRGEAQETATN